MSGLTLAWIACAAPPQPSAAAASAGAETPQPSAASAQLAASDLRGSWVEYWALSGSAATESYAFSAQGRFAWRAAPDPPQPRRAVHKAGTFRLETDGHSQFLILEVQRERFAGCAAPCTSAGASAESLHSTPLIERYELGDCPHNPEAERVDATYTCHAIGGKAFWRKSLHEPEPS